MYDMAIFKSGDEFVLNVHSFGFFAIFSLHIGFMHSHRDDSQVSNIVWGDWKRSFVDEQACPSKIRLWREF